MRTHLCCTIVVATVAVVLLSPAAGAKGAQDLTIDGAGIATPISVSNRDGDVVGRLAEYLGFYPAVFAEVPDPMSEEAPSGDLGPVLGLTWRLPTGESSDAFVRQRLYPYAAAGPVVYTEPGQPTFATTSTRGGWYHGRAAAVAMLNRLGVPDRATLDAAAAPATSAARPASPSTSRTGYQVMPWTLAAVAGLVVVAAAGWRRRARVAPA